MLDAANISATALAALAEIDQPKVTVVTQNANATPGAPGQNVWIDTRPRRRIQLTVPEGSSST